MLPKLHGTKEIVAHTGQDGFRLYINTEEENYPPHWHTDLEIIMPIENTYTVIVNKITYELMPYDIIIIPSCEIHELLAPPEGIRMIFQIDYSMLHEVSGFDSIYTRFFPCAIFRTAENQNEYHILSDFLQQIANEYDELKPFYEASIHALILSFFVKAGRTCLNQSDSFAAVKEQKHQIYIDTFFNICTYINEHCSENLTLEQLAEMSSFSKSHFIRLFKEFSGVSYYEYLTKRRILRSELLLNNPEYSIAEIAMRSGFNSLATFNRVFKSAHGLTPSEYRKHAMRH